MYQVLIGGIPFPMGPSKISTKTGSRSQTIELINGNEVNLVRGPKLREWTIDITLPSQNYPYMGFAGKMISKVAGSATGVLTNTIILEFLESVKAEKLAFPLTILRMGDTGALTHCSNVCERVTLEEYTVLEDASNGCDLDVNLLFKEFVPFSTKVYNQNGTISKGRL